MTNRTWIFKKEYMHSLEHFQEALHAGARGDRGEANPLSDAKIEAARRRLRECADAAETLEAIREIASNLLGCETMHLLRLDRNKGAFSPFWSFGIDAVKRSMMDALDAPASSCAASGSTYIHRNLEDRSAGGCHSQVTVFVPIHCNGEVTAVLALLQFLPQKLGLDNIDNEIFRILSEEAGSMLFCRETAATASGSPERKS